MRFARFIRFVPLVLLLWAGSAWAAKPLLVSPEEFEALCVELSGNVDLFKKIWEADPSAQVYGGTSRDFIWFVRGELAKAGSPGELKAIVDRLRGRPIRIEEFVVGQSDVDVVTAKDLTQLDFDRAFLTRIETISPDWFAPGKSTFEQEKLQGHVPVEKIRLGRGGFARAEGLDQGNGVREIFDGRPTLHLNPRIIETDYFKQHENHPVLLTLRYLRQVAITYYRLHGNEYPKLEDLLSLMDESSAHQVRETLESIRHDPSQLKPFVENPAFLRRLNKALDKAFRSYTNPTATKVLFEYFGIDRLLAVHGDKIDPYHTLIYRKHRSPPDVAKQRGQLGLGDGYVSTIDAYFKEHGLEPEVFHGTGSMAAYRSIVFQGNIASTEGNAGAGVYAVDNRSKAFAETVRGDKTLVVKLKLDPKATFVDITQGEGQKAYEAFEKSQKEMKWLFGGNEREPEEQDSYSAFADFVGADVLKYPYGEHHAYVIKNGGAVKGQEGITHPLLTVEQARRKVDEAPDKIAALKKMVEFDPGLLAHWDYLLGSVPEKERGLLAAALASELKDQDALVRVVLGDPYWAKHPEGLARIVDAVLAGGKRKPYTDLALIEVLFSRPHSEALAPQLTELIKQTSHDFLLMRLLNDVLSKPHFREKSGLQRAMADRIGALMQAPDGLDASYHAIDNRVPLIQFYLANSGKSLGDGISFVIDAAASHGNQKLLAPLLHILVEKGAPNGFLPQLRQLIAAAKSTELLAEIAAMVENISPPSERVEFQRGIAGRFGKAIETLGQEGGGVDGDQDFVVNYYLEHSGKTKAAALDFVLTHAIEAGYSGMINSLAEEHFSGVIDGSLEKPVRALIEMATSGQLMRAVCKLLDRNDAPASLKRALADRIIHLQDEPYISVDFGWEPLSFYLKHSGRPYGAALETIIWIAGQRGQDHLMRPVVKNIFKDPENRKRYPRELLKLIQGAKDYQLLGDLMEVADTPEYRQALAQSVGNFIWNKNFMPAYEKKLVDYYLANSGWPFARALEILIEGQARSKAGGVGAYIAENIWAWEQQHRGLRPALEKLIDSADTAELVNSIAKHVFNDPAVRGDAALSKRLTDKMIPIIEACSYGMPGWMSAASFDVLYHEPTLSDAWRAKLVEGVAKTVEKGARGYGPDREWLRLFMEIRADETGMLAALLKKPEGKRLKRWALGKLEFPKGRRDGEYWVGGVKLGDAETIATHIGREQETPEGRAVCAGALKGLR